MNGFQIDSSSTENPHAEILKNRSLIDALEKRIKVFEGRNIDNALYSLLKYTKVACILLPLFFLIFLGTYLFINNEPVTSQVIISVGAILVIINVLGYFVKNLGN